MAVGNQVAIVTGGAGVIGSETAVQLAAAGWAVVINGRDPQRCDAAAERLRARFPDAAVLPVVADLTDYAACQRLVAETEAAFGRLDAVIHCAMSSPPGLTGLFEGTDPAQYEALMRMTVCNVMYLCRAALPALARAGGGAIVAFPSDSGKVAAPNQTMVGTTRAAVMMFMRSLALEASAQKVRCNCIAPTYVDTPALRRALDGPHAGRIAKATAKARLGLPTPEELAALAVFLCSPAAAHLTGQVISVNGGLSAA